MKLIIGVGPDTLGTSKFKSLKAFERARDRLLKKKVSRPDSCEIVFLGRKYTRYEIEDAFAYTPSGFYKLVAID